MVRAARFAKWKPIHFVTIYGSGIAAAFVGQTIAHSLLQPDERLPVSRKAAHVNPVALSPFAAALEVNKQLEKPPGNQGSSGSGGTHGDDEKRR